jgi:GNAT superfamily N-acetyltransferase
MTTTAALVPAADRDVALAPLVTAFSTDPIIRWLYPDAHSYLTHFPRTALLLGGEAFTTGTADSTEEAIATALWLTPGTHPDEEAIGESLAASLDPSRHEAVFAFLEEIEGYFPDEPVWYLPVIGVDPRFQGRALGSALLQRGLARADAEGTPAYLEASSARSRTLYERHGFSVIGEVRAADSPPAWPMLRDPR